jgi:hypothetical protein
LQIILKRCLDNEALKIGASIQRLVNFYESNIFDEFLCRRGYKIELSEFAWTRILICQIYEIIKINKKLKLNLHFSADFKFVSRVTR